MENSSNDFPFIISITDPNILWPFLSTSLIKHLPLQNVIWNNTVMKTKHILFNIALEFNILNQESKKDDKSLVYLYLVKCENIESYDETKRCIIEWMCDKKEEYLLLWYIPLGTCGSTSLNLKNSKKIFEKLKMDFKKTNIITTKIEVSNLLSSVLESQWSSLVGQLQVGIVSRLEKTCFVLEKNVQEMIKLYNSDSSFNVFSFLKEKEKVALLYLKLTLFENAIQQVFTWNSKR